MKETIINLPENVEIVVRADGTKYWYQHYKLHRADGPAIEYPDYRKGWWYYEGRCFGSHDIMPEDFPRQIKKKNKTNTETKISNLVGSYVRDRDSGKVFKIVEEEKVVKLRAVSDGFYYGRVNQSYLNNYFEPCEDPNVSKKKELRKYLVNAQKELEKIQKAFKSLED